MGLYFKNMVSKNCILLVTRELQKLNLEPVSVGIGKADLAKAVTDEQLMLLNYRLKPLGFGLDFWTSKNAVKQAIKNF